MVKTTTNSTHGFGTLNQFFSSLPLNMDSQGPRERSEKISLKKKKKGNLEQAEIIKGEDKCQETTKNILEVREYIRTMNKNTVS